MRRRISQVLVLAVLLLVVVVLTPPSRPLPRAELPAQPKPPISWDALGHALDAQAWWYATIQAEAASTPVVVSLPRKSVPSPSSSSGLEPCGGDLPPCWVKRRESRGNYSAYNPRGCSGRGCGGAWQFDPRTWNGYGGYAEAQDAPPEVQDAKAREVWAGGSGCAHWAAC